MITLFKEVKKGLPNFSNITASMTINIDETTVDGKEVPDGWKFINEEIKKQLQIIPPEVLASKADITEGKPF